MKADKELKDYIKKRYEFFNSIRDLLRDIELNKLDNIIEAYDIADNMSDKLY